MPILIQLQAQCHGKTASPARLALHLYAALHGVYDSLGNRHAKTRALDMCLPHLFIPEKRYENILPELFCHTNPAVFHDEYKIAEAGNPLGHFFYGQFNDSVPRRIFDGIGHQV